MLAGILGGLIGSFLNVVVHRVPRGESIVSPPSACPACGHRIRWYDNIPVVSWLILRGRCRDCGAPISIRYPLVELAAAAAFVAVAWWRAPALVAGIQAGGAAPWAALAETLAWLWLAAASIALTIIDVEVKRLPNPIVYTSIGVVAAFLTLAAALTGDWASLGRAGLAALALGGFYLLVAVVVPGGMGLGDVKLAVLLGLALGWIGWPELAVGALAAFVLGAVFGLALLAVERRGRGVRIPFGPWMLAGAWVGAVVGGPVWAWYLGVAGLA